MQEQDEGAEIFADNVQERDFNKNF